MKKVNVGDVVTVKEAHEAHYSRYAGNPLLQFTPGMKGVVASINVPKVRHTPGTMETFNCVDYRDPATGRIERVSVETPQLVERTIDPIPQFEVGDIVLMTAEHIRSSKTTDETNYRGHVGEITQIGSSGLLNTRIDGVWLELLPWEVICGLDAIKSYRDEIVEEHTCLLLGQNFATSADEYESVEKRLDEIDQEVERIDRVIKGVLI